MWIKQSDSLATVIKKLVFVIVGCIIFVNLIHHPDDSPATPVVVVPYVNTAYESKDMKTYFGRNPDNIIRDVRVSQDSYTLTIDSDQWPTSKQDQEVFRKLLWENIYQFESQHHNGKAPEWAKIMEVNDLVGNRITSYY